MRRLLSWKQLLEEYGHPFSRTQTWRKARDPEDPFPAPVSAGQNRIAWYSDEYEAWQGNLPRVNYAPEPAEEPAPEPEAVARCRSSPP